MDQKLAEIIKKIPDYISQPFWLDTEGQIFICGTGTVGRDVYRLVDQIAQESNLHYNYYLRGHAQNSFDTVLYAVPTSPRRSA